MDEFKTKEQMSRTLPNAPPTLCFRKDELSRENLNVEEFIVECRRRVSLEIMRDDLAVYLKILQSAMIELINKDYADFVNLSTNLVGMDKAINNLIHPLLQLRTDNLNVKAAMDDAIKSVQDKLRKQTEIRHKKATLQRLRSIINSVEKMEKIIGVHQNGNSARPSELTGQLIERVASQFNKLQFLVSKTRGLPLVEEIKPRIAQITTTLQWGLESALREGLEARDVERLRQCLRTYATIDKMRDAENLFRQHSVKPYMEQVINETYLAENPDGLQGMFNAVLDFIPKYCSILDEATIGGQEGYSEVVRGYDFAVNAVWPEVVSNIEVRTPTIFAPGNPNIFHQRFQTSNRFVSSFEEACGCLASVRRLRAHPAYNTFMAKWSLPVYFQIRFQEIASTLEASLAEPAKPVKSDGLHLAASQALWTSIQQCWLPQIYLWPLAHRFWKLTLQLLSRYHFWLVDLSENKLEKTTTEESVNGVVSRGHRRTGSYGGLSAQQRNATGNGDLGGAEQNSNMPSVASSIDLLRHHATANEKVDVTSLSSAQCAAFIADTQILSSRLPSFFSTTIEPLLGRLGDIDLKILQEGIEECGQALMSVRPRFESFITSEIARECCCQLKSVNDIPRLYRRTNREKPNKPSSYVELMIQPLKEFLQQQDEVLSTESCKKLSENVIVTVCQQYLAMTSDVLTSVRKMEESLKRLKKSKSGTPVGTSNGVSDDDKIRHQFVLDVNHLGKQIVSLTLSCDSISPYGELLTVVETA